MTEISLGYAFIAGIITSFTPCVYPLIPITLALFGACEEGSYWRSFLLSLTYVLGISATYTVLGILSALSGAVFGDLLSNPWVLAAICSLLFYLCLTTLEIIQMRFLCALQAKASKLSAKGFLGAFTMGLVSGVVAAPCVGPVLANILVIAAHSQDLVQGALLLFSYSFGFGLIFLVLGTFSDMIKFAPKSGNWLLFVKFLVASGLLLLIAFLLKPYHHEFTTSLFSQISPLLLKALLVGALLAGYRFITLERKIPALTAALLIACFSFLLIFPADQHSQAKSLDMEMSLEEGVWIASSEQAFAAAQKLNKPVLVDLYAEWCIACKELEDVTFKDKQVVERLKKFVLARVDYEQERELVEKYKIIGLPCILFLNPDGTEIPETRINGFVNAEEFLASLDNIGL